MNASRKLTRRDLLASGTVAVVCLAAERFRMPRKEIGATTSDLGISSVNPGFRHQLYVDAVHSEGQAIPPSVYLDRITSLNHISRTLHQSNRTLAEKTKAVKEVRDYVCSPKLLSLDPDFYDSYCALFRGESLPQRAEREKMAGNFADTMGVSSSIVGLVNPGAGVGLAVGAAFADDLVIAATDPASGILNNPFRMPASASEYELLSRLVTNRAIQLYDANQQSADASDNFIIENTWREMTSLSPSADLDKICKDLPPEQAQLVKRIESLGEGKLTHAQKKELHQEVTQVVQSALDKSLRRYELFIVQGRAHLIQEQARINAQRELDFTVRELKSAVFIGDFIATHIFRDPEAGKQITAIGNSAVMIFSSMASVGTMGTFGVVAGVIAGISGLFGLSSGPDYDRLTYETVQRIEKKIDLLRKEVQQLRAEMHQRFDHLVDIQLEALDKLTFIIHEMQSGNKDIKSKIDDLRQEFEIGYVLMADSAMHSEHAYFDLQINKAKDLIERRAQGESISYQEFAELLSNLHGYGENNAAMPVFTGSHVESWDPEKFRAILSKIRNPYEAVGLLPSIIEEFALKSVTRSVVNPFEWAKAVQAFCELRISFPQYSILLHDQWTQELWEQGVLLRDTLNLTLRGNTLQAVGKSYWMKLVGTAEMPKDTASFDEWYEKEVALDSTKDLARIRSAGSRSAIEEIYAHIRAGIDQQPRTVAGSDCLEPYPWRNPKLSLQLAKIPGDANNFRHCVKAAKIAKGIANGPPNLRLIRVQQGPNQGYYSLVGETIEGQAMSPKHPLFVANALGIIKLSKLPVGEQPLDLGFTLKGNPLGTVTMYRIEFVKGRYQGSVIGNVKKDPQNKNKTITTGFGIYTAPCTDENNAQVEVIYEEISPGETISPHDKRKQRQTVNCLNLFDILNQEIHNELGIQRGNVINSLKDSLRSSKNMAQLEGLATTYRYLCGLTHASHGESFHAVNAFIHNHFVLATSENARNAFIDRSLDPEAGITDFVQGLSPDLLDGVGSTVAPRLDLANHICREYLRNIWLQMTELEDQLKAGSKFELSPVDTMLKRLAAYMKAKKIPFHPPAGMTVEETVSLGS